MAKDKSAEKKSPNISQGSIKGVMDVALTEVVAPEKFNARKSYEGTESAKRDSRQSIEELAESIKKDGLHQPVGVRKLGGKFSLIYGFRRFKAMQLLAEKHPKDDAFQSIRAQVREGDDKDAYLVNLTENCSRNDLLAHELADRCCFLSKEYSMSGSEIGKRIGKSVPYINTLIRISDKCAEPILEAWRKQPPGGGVLTTDTLARWAAMEKSEQMEHFRTATAKGKEESKGANGANGTASDGSDGDGDGANKPLRRPSDSKVEKCMAAVEAAYRAKKIDKERYRGYTQMYNFMTGLEDGIPGIWSPSKEKNAPKAKPSKRDVDAEA